MGDPTRAAVLIVDLQVGVIRDCHDPAGTVARTQDLVERARAEGAPVVWVLDHSEFEPETPDWQLPAPLQALPGEPVIRKRYRDAFCETELLSTLMGGGEQRRHARAPRRPPPRGRRLPVRLLRADHRSEGCPGGLRRDAGRRLPHDR